MLVAVLRIIEWFGLKWTFEGHVVLSSCNAQGHCLLVWNETELSIQKSVNIWVQPPTIRCTVLKPH